MSSRIPVPLYVDSPQQVLIFSIDELVPVVLFLGLGILIDQAFILTCAGIGLAKAQRRYIDSMPDGFMLHWLYWTGLYPVKSRTLPNALRRVWTA